MAGKTQSLDQVYGAKDSGAIRKAYQDWSGEYDPENLAKGYRLPGIGAGFAARYIPVDTAPILDAGCGTGLVGEALSILGYQDIAGADISAAMLEIAKSHRVYSRLFEHDLGVPLPEQDNSFGAVVCFGSLGPGHAPSSCLAEFIRVTRPGGYIVFNVRPDTWVEQGLKKQMDALTEAGAWQLAEQSPVFRPFLLAEPEVITQVFAFRVS